MKHYKVLFFLFFLLPCTGAAGEEAHPFSAADLVRFARVLDPQISPGGTTLAFTLRETDMAANAGFTDVWLLDLTDPDAAPERFTTHPQNDAYARWSADGRRVYFLSNRSGRAQVWAKPAAGGEAFQVTGFPLDVSFFALSPDGRRLAFTAAVYPACQNLECTANRAALMEQNPEKGRVYDRLIMRFWDAWRDGRKSQLHAVALDREGRAEGEPVNLMAGMAAEVPAYARIGPESFTFSADGRHLYFSTKIQDEDESWSVDTNLYRVPADGRGEPVNLTGASLGADDHPVVSPDGRWLAWLSTEAEDEWAAAYRIKLMDLGTGAVSVLAQGWDRTPAEIAFARDSGALYAASDHLGQRVLWRVPLDGGAPELLAGLGWVSGLAPVPDGVVFSRSDLSRPADFYLYTGGGVRRLTRVNDAMLAKVETGEYQQFSFQGAGGETVYGYVVHPAGYSKQRKYPVAFIIHGGPHGSMGNLFHYRWNPQVFAGAGYAAVFIDFHGSTGYGQRFVESIQGDRGGATLEDLRLGLEAALARYPWLDGERVCALGGSFGGYMVNLIAGLWPERFRCLVTHSGMFDNRMKYYAGDIIGYLEEGFGGDPYFEDPEAHERFNPANHVENWQTPLLVIHGENDYRVPITHGIAAFTAAQRKGVPSRFLYFPDENHWVLSPANSIQWHREVLRWLDRWLRR